MHVSIAYSDNPDSSLAGQLAAKDALRKSGRNTDCDLAFLFATSRHDALTLKEGVSAVLGKKCPLVGGSVLSIVTNEYFGYGGHQVLLAAFWFDKENYSVFHQPGLDKNAQECGRRLGRQMSEAVTPEVPVMLFYDPINHDKHNKRSLVMATPLLKGLEEGLGYSPNLVGAGLLGDYFTSDMPQWIGYGLGKHNALAIAFPKVIMEKVVMPGCYPGTAYYTITKTNKNAILEIEGLPALDFIRHIMGTNIKPEAYPMLLMLGVNKGSKWDDYNEEQYTNRLCFSVNKKEKSLVMFEDDLIKGTEIQIMFRTSDQDYMPQTIERMFSKLEGRTPVLAFYIDCAGRAASYAGKNLDEPLIIQTILKDRVPLLGIYTGVEMAWINNQARALDWCGLFCLFSI